MFYQTITSFFIWDKDLLLIIVREGHFSRISLLCFDIISIRSVTCQKISKGSTWKELDNNMVIHVFNIKSKKLLPCAMFKEAVLYLASINMLVVKGKKRKLVADLIIDAGTWRDRDPGATDPGLKNQVQNAKCLEHGLGQSTIKYLHKKLKKQAMWNTKLFKVIFFIFTLQPTWLGGG